MKKKIVSMLLIVVMAVNTFAGCGKPSSSEAGTTSAEEGKVINIYSWNDEFRERVEAVYPEVKETSSDGTVTTLMMGQRFIGL